MVALELTTRDKLQTYWWRPWLDGPMQTTYCEATNDQIFTIRTLRIKNLRLVQRSTFAGVAARVAVISKTNGIIYRRACKYKGLVTDPSQKDQALI